MAYIIDGKKVSATIKEELKETVSEYTKANISITREFDSCFEKKSPLSYL